MSASKPQLTLRLGTHAEKEYLERLAPYLGGFIFGANLLESTPGATASLVVTYAGAKRALPYYVDPMTYAFGSYVDGATGEDFSDLDWLKSDKQVKGTGKKKETVRTFKPSYISLADEFGSVIERAISKEAAVTPTQLAKATDREAFVKAVLDYQLKRIRREFENDGEFARYASEAPLPSAVFAPYFYCDPTDGDAWLTENLWLAKQAATHKLAAPVHAILCADQAHLIDDAFVARVIKELPQTGVKGVWLWFSRFDEARATLPHLMNFRRIVQELSAAKLEVHNLHGGYYSLALSKLGLAGVSHGVGYGEQKDVTPVLGQSVPTVRYYLPPLYRRLGVAAIDRALGSMGVKTPADFHEKVCGCAVCRGIVVNKVAEFGLYFGETHPSKGKTKREVQTPQAARRCRFHFLLNRLRECEEIGELSLADLRKRFEEDRDGWGNQPSLESDAKHLNKWLAALV